MPERWSNDSFFELALGTRPRCRTRPSPSTHARRLLPGIYRLISYQKAGYHRGVFDASVSCCSSIRGRSVMSQCDRVRTAGKSVERRPIGISERQRNAPIFGTVECRLRSNCVIGQKSLAFLLVQNRLLMLTEVRPERIAVTGLDPDEDDSCDCARSCVRGLLGETRCSAQHESQRGEWKAFVHCVLVTGGVRRTVMGRVP